MAHILNTGYSVLNPIAGPSGIAVAGSADSGSLSQYNNGKADTISPGDASKDGSIKSLLATDSSDTVNLGLGWQSAGYAVDDTTGIAGTLYTSSTGDQMLISGNATVNLSGTPAPTVSVTPSSSTPAPTAAATPSSPTPSFPTSAPAIPATPGASKYYPNYFQPAATAGYPKKPKYPYQTNSHSNWLDDYLSTITVPDDSSSPTAAPAPYKKFPSNKWYTLNPITPYVGDGGSSGVSYYSPSGLGELFY